MKELKTLPRAARAFGRYRARARKRSATLSRNSPVGLAAWFYEKFAEWTDTDGDPERELTKDEMLDDITLYWLTNTAASSARIYWEDNSDKTKAGEVSIPAAVSRFPREIIPVPRSWAEAPTPTSCTSTNSRRAVTSPPGNNRNSLRARCERRSARCAKQSDHFGARNARADFPSACQVFRTEENDHVRQCFFAHTARWPCRFCSRRCQPGLLPAHASAPVGPSQFNTDRTHPGQWTITFSNPPINMFVPTTIVELGALMTELEADPSVKVLVFQSANPDFFIAPSRRFQERD